MATFEFFNPASDKRTQSDVLEQLVDVIGDDVSSSLTRRKYQVWVTGSGVSAGVTSSLFQTVYDQDFTLQTANPVFDVTIGIHTSSVLIPIKPLHLSLVLWLELQSRKPSSFPLNACLQEIK